MIRTSMKQILRHGGRVVIMPTPLHVLRTDAVYTADHVFVYDPDESTEDCLVGEFVKSRSDRWRTAELFEVWIAECEHTTDFDVADALLRLQEIEEETRNHPPART